MASLIGCLPVRTPPPRPRYGDDLGMAWDEFDVDKDGSISQDEWDGLMRKACYYGPTQPIFDFLDTDDEVGRGSTIHSDVPLSGTLGAAQMLGERGRWGLPFGGAVSPLRGV